MKCTGPAAVFRDDRIKWRELARKLDTAMNRMKFTQDEQENENSSFCSGPRCPRHRWLCQCKVMASRVESDLEEGEGKS